MSFISEHINTINTKGEKVLSVFLTAGYPEKKIFTGLAADIIEAGADMLEIGIPFSDPLADGPVIQSSSQNVISNGITMKEVFEFTSVIKSKRDIPLILMGYANPILRYGIMDFFQDAVSSGADGVIIPDVPYEEYDSFYCQGSDLDKILLVTPTSSEERIIKIDQLSTGFLYCVSVTGVTGVLKQFSEATIESIKQAYSIIKKNKMLLGFGISNEESIEQVKNYCDGVIVGSAVIKLLTECGIKETLALVEKLKAATRNSFSVLNR